MLRTNGVEPEIVEYLKTPPSRDELTRILTALGVSPRDLLRKREKEYKELGLADPTLSDDQIIDAIVDHPRLMERPIVTSGDRAVVGRPIERVLEVVD